MRELRAAASTLTDLAIALRFAMDGEMAEDQYRLQALHRLGSPKPESIEECVDGDDILAAKLIRAILAQAGVPEDACSMTGVRKARGWAGRNPTKAEWKEFFARMGNDRRAA